MSPSCFPASWEYSYRTSHVSLSRVVLCVLVICVLRMQEGKTALNICIENGKMEAIALLEG
jgi:hypothetical protein